MKTPNTAAPVEYIYRRCRIPKVTEFLAAVGGALSSIMYPTAWEQGGDMSPETAAAMMKELYLDWQRSDQFMIGTIQAYATTFPPSGMLPCTGEIYARSDYPELYALIADAFIVDAEYFRVPDLRGRTVIGVGTGDGLTGRTVNEQGGAESVTLTSDEMPAHSHTTNPHQHSIPYGQIGHPSNTLDPEFTLAGPLPVFATYTSSDTVTVNSTGQGESHENMPPYVALAYGIWAR